MPLYLHCRQKGIGDQLSLVFSFDLFFIWFLFSMRDTEKSPQSGLLLFYSEREPVRPGPAGFRYWRTPEKTSSILHQVSNTI